MAEVQFKCPQCGQMVEADVSYCGKVAICPSCGKGIVVPRNVSPISATKQARSEGKTLEENGGKQQLESARQHTNGNAENRAQNQEPDSSLVRMRRPNVDFTTRRAIGNSGARIGARTSSPSVLDNDAQFVAPTVARILYWLFNIGIVICGFVQVVVSFIEHKGNKIIGHGDDKIIGFSALILFIGVPLGLLFNRLWYEFAIAMFEGIKHLRQIRDELKSVRKTQESCYKRG